MSTCCVQGDGIRFEEPTFSCRTEEHNGIVLLEFVIPKPGGILRIFKSNVVSGGS